MNAMNHVPASDYELWGRWMNDSSSRTLYLLRDIERTVTVVGTIRDAAHSFTRAVHDLCEGLPAVAETIPEDDVLGLFAEVQNHLEKLHRNLDAKFAAAKVAPELCEEDGVAAVYREAIDAVCAWHEGVEDLRWNIMQHNAALDTSDPGPVLSTPDEIKAFLDAL